MERKIKSLIDRFSNKKTKLESKPDILLAKDELKTLKTNIEFMQHERLVHLLVTMFFAFLLLSFVALFFYFKESAFGIIALLLLLLEGFYIKHYFILENGTQKLYEIYDDIEKLTKHPT